MPGTKIGAEALLKVLAPAGMVPASWNKAPGLLNKEYPGGYRVTTWVPGSAATPDANTGVVTVQWGNFTANETIQYTWNKDTRSLKDDSANIPDTGEVKQESLLGIPDAVGSIVGGTIDSVSGLISAITSPELWKRIGIGAAGVVMVLIAIVFFTKKGIDAA